MPDEWEKKYGFNPNDPEDADLDADRDGFTNLAEHRGGTDPVGLVELPKSISTTTPN